MMSRGPKDRNASPWNGEETRSRLILTEQQEQKIEDGEAERPERPSRDYFRVETQEGLRFWLYRDGRFQQEGACAALVSAGHLCMTCGYAELAVTTNYSFLRGASHPAQFVEQAEMLGCAAIGIADRNSAGGCGAGL